ncbi:MAG: spermidine/putrescine ABC transporter substrate-binding protein [Mogibacterium sp.]|nr:spermidine/putrescine ABC transporter substrate-binding protein [Mogibacterium sp.]MBR2540602.1 spermidine/putrescine ABC transporter substrate-binding protein [Mogibacterium sp.]
MFVIVASIGLSACSSESNGEVYVYSYGDYFDPAITEDFEAETGIKVILDTYDTAEEMYTVIQNDATTYDCICTSDYMIEKMISNEMLAELNKDNIPELENISDVYMKKSEVFDPGNKYSVPYMAGIAGIIYNKEMVGDTEIDSWEDLWDEKFADSMVMPDSVRDAFMIALKKLGYSENSTDENEIKAAADELIKQKPLVYKYANDSARDLLADGSAAIGVVWNGEYMYTKDLNENVEYVVPKEGSEFFIDSWIIPAKAANKENAEKWIDYLCRAEVAAKNFDYLYYTTPNEAALELIDEEVLGETAIFPTDDTINSCESLRMLDDATTDLYSKYWKEVKAN